MLTFISWKKIIKTLRDSSQSSKEREGNLLQTSLIQECFSLEGQNWPPQPQALSIDDGKPQGYAEAVKSEKLPGFNARTAPKFDQ